MGKSFALGTVIVFAAILASFIKQDLAVFTQLVTIVGVLCVIAAAVLSGGLVNGDRHRGNTATEDAEDQRERQSISLRIFVFGIPSLLSIFIYYQFIS